MIQDFNQPLQWHFERSELQMLGWQEAIAGVPVGIELPFDWPRPLERRFRLERLSIPTPTALDGLLRQCLCGERIARPLIWLAALATLLHRYSSETRLLIASPAANGEADRTRMWQLDVQGGETFAQLVTAIVALGGPLGGAEDLSTDSVRAARTGDLGAYHTPIFHAGFVADFSGPDSVLEGWLPCSDLTLRCRRGDPAALEFLYNGELFSAEAIARAAGHLHELVRSAMKNEATPVCRLSMLTTEERRRMLVDWNRTEAAYPKNRYITDLIADQAERAPDAPALVYRNHTLTYSDLDRQSNRLAHHLLSTVDHGRA